MKPLICILSIRDIPEVKRLWHTIPYDKYIVKYKTHKDAYIDISEYFKAHTEYDTMIISSDNLEITPAAIDMLLYSADIHGLLTVSGYCNIDETQPDTYAVQPLGSQDWSRDKPNTTFGSYYSKDKKPILPTENTLLEVGFEGFCCQVIRRELFNKIDLVGPDHIRGNFDWNFCKQMHFLRIPLYVDTRVKMYHRRFQQMDRVKEFQDNPGLHKNGYSYLLKSE